MQSADNSNQTQKINPNGVQIIYRNMAATQPVQYIIHHQQQQQMNHQQCQLHRQEMPQQNVPHPQNQPRQFQHQLPNQLQLQRQQQTELGSYLTTPNCYQRTIKYTPTNETRQLIQVNPVYTPTQAFQQQQQLPPPSSMISPPMEMPSQGICKIPPWQQNRQQPFVLPSVGGNDPPIYAMSSYLTDDRAAETPVPMPVECTLGMETPDTPSPSLPSHSPPVDTSVDPLFFWMSQFQDESEEKSRKRRTSKDCENINLRKRHRRTKAEIAADNLEVMMKSIKPCQIIVKPVDFKVEDMPARVFVGSKGFIVRTDLPRIPRMKKVPTSFNRISSIGFMRSNHGIAFSCMDHCKFKTYDPIKFQRHLTNHEKRDQDDQVKTCHICNAVVSRNSLLFELLHMLKVHLATPEQIHYLPIQEILYSTILNSSLEAADSSDESEEESESTDVYSRCTSPELAPSVDLTSQVAQGETLEDFSISNPQEMFQRTSSECSDDSGKTEIYPYESQEKVASTDIPLEDVDKLIEELEGFEPSDDESADIPSTQTQETENDPDYIPNDEIESEDATVADTAMPSDEKASSKEAPVTTDDDWSDNQPLASTVVKNTFILSPPLKRLKLNGIEIESDPYDPDYSPNGDVETEDEPVPDEEVTSDEEKVKNVKTSPILLSLKELKELKKKEVKEARKKRRSRRETRKLGKIGKRRRLSKSSGSENRKKQRINFKSEGSQETEEAKSCAVEQFSERPTETVHCNKISEEQQSNECPIRSRANGENIVEEETETRLVIEDKSAKAAGNCDMRIPLSVIRKIVQSRPRSQNEQKTDINATAEASMPVEPSKCPEQLMPTRPNVEILSDIVLTPGKDKFDEPRNKPYTRSKGRLGKRFEGLPTARKSTSKLSSNAQKELFEKFKIKRCKVNLVNSLKRIKLIIENGNKAGVVTLNTNTKISADDVAGTSSKTEQSNILNLSQSSDINEIDYEENEGNEQPNEDLPVAMKDFPAVLTLSLLDSPSKGANTKGEISEKNETDDDLFFDCESVNLPQTPLTPEIEDVADVANPLAAEEGIDEREMTTNELMFVEVFNEPPKEKLLNLSELYPWIDDEIVEKWLKTESCAEAMLNARYMFSTYKCMSISCSYFTTDIKKFEKHVEKHRNVDKHFICSFCLSDELQPEHLFKHLRTVHKYDRYQCSKCMYRACEKFYCDMHRKKFHASIEDVNALIYKSPTQEEILPRKRWNVQRSLEKKLDTIAKPMQCKCESL